MGPPRISATIVILYYLPVMDVSIQTKIDLRIVVCFPTSILSLANLDRLVFSCDLIELLVLY